MSDPSATGAVGQIDQHELSAIATTARTHGACVIRADLAACADKAALLTRIADAFAFPATFGHNWDALADCLGDLAWLPRGNGYVWLFGHADELRKAAPADCATFVEILDAACASWRRRHVACRACIGFDRLPGPPRR